jgi:hypothetical protein
MKNWPADYSPSSLETSANQMQPTADELDKYARGTAAEKAAAKTAIEAKAVIWFNAVYNDLNARSNAWVAAARTAAGMPADKNCLLATQYYHPKISNLPDGVTDFWPAGIQINVSNPGSGLVNMKDPDAIWSNVQGVAYGKIAIIFKNYGTAARLRAVCRHEIGHATKAVFKRKLFGTGDHSTAGTVALMEWTATDAVFNATELDIIRGLD